MNTELEEKEIVKIQNLDCKNLRFAKSRNTSSSTAPKFIKGYYNKKPLVITLPVMDILFDVKNSYSKLEMSLTVESPELLKKLNEFDSYINDTASVQNGWFNPNDTDWTFLPFVKGLNSDKFSPFIKLKIPVNKEGKYDTKFYNSNKELINIETESDITNLLKRGKKVVTAIELSSVWMATTPKKQWGVSFKLVQLKLSEIEDPEDDYPFSDTSDISETDMCLIDDDE